MAVLLKVGERQSLTERAYQVIKEAIISNNIKPGEKLLEEELTINMGVSRTTIRSALQRLDYEKWVQIIPGVGTVVATLESDDARNLFMVRRPLELLSIEMAIDFATADDIQDLDNILSEQKNLNQEGEYIGVIEKNQEFHDRIAQISNNPWLREILHNLGSQLQRFFILSQNMEKRCPRIVKEHELILQALKSHNKESAKEFIQKHITWKEEV